MQNFTQLRRLCCAVLLLCAWASAGSATPTTDVVISEIMFDPTGGDNNHQWVEIYNGTGGSINLANYSLGWGRDDFTLGTLQLTGTLQAGDTWVIGGPTSDAANDFPVFDQALDFSPNLRRGNSGGTTDGVALFDVPAASITAVLDPIHSVIYGRTGASTVLIDELGAVGSPLFVTDGFAAGTSIEFYGDNDWRVQANATAGSVPAAIPERDTASLLFVGLLLLRGTRAAQQRGLIVI